MELLRRHPLRAFMALFFGGLLTIIGLILLAFVIYYQNAKRSADWPHIETLRPDRLGQNSMVYAADNSRLGTIAAEENRRIIPLDQMGKWLPKATVAIEDQRFYDHDGVDQRGMARAVVVNLKARGYVEGASTIDQQLVRNIYEEIGKDRTIKRKLKEASLARELNMAFEDQYGSHRKAKEKILGLYLNFVYFGNTAYGAEAGAQTYFSVPASHLTLAQAALLAGLIQQPTAYDPFKVPEQAVARRNTVLDAMRAQGMIDESEAEQAKKAPLGLKRGKTFQARINPYFFDYVQQELVRAYDKKTVKTGGLRVQTTLDPKMQRLAVNEMKSVLGASSDPVAAMVVIDNDNGEIKVMASSSTYRKTQFNFAADATRQPGSAAKTWVLAAFLRAGADPDIVKYLSTPLKVEPAPGAGIWEPKTYDGSYVGLIDVRRATVRSDNSVYAQMTMDLSPQKVAAAAKALGIESKLTPLPSIGLGSQGVTPLELTNFYATIARGGLAIQPTAIRNVRTVSGAKDATVIADPVRVMYGWQADKIISILEDNVQSGTGTAAQIPGVPVSGKTGTTDDYKDAWFCGMTPKYTSCVWVGYPKPRPMTNVHGISVAGGTYPAQIWGQVMRKVRGVEGDGRWPSIQGKERFKPFVPGWCNDPEVTVIVGPRSADCSSTKEDELRPDEQGVLELDPDSSTARRLASENRELEQASGD